MKHSKIGVFGGTFDPVHNGHLQLAHLAVEEVGLAKLLFIPAAEPPHKSAVFTPINQRIAMLELVCRDSDTFICSSIEKHLPKPSYTIDTVLELKKKFSENTEFYFIIGSDAFLDLRTWKAYRTLLSLVQIVVSPRIGYPDHLLSSFLGAIGYTMSDSGRGAKGPGKDIVILSSVPQGFCSSDIRKIIAMKGDTTTMLPPAVARYIKKNSLYNP